MNKPDTTRLLAKTRHALIAAPLLLALGAPSAVASQLIYTPVNPSFGGNALNGPYLLDIAKQQASKSAPDPLAGLDLSSFNESLEEMSQKLDQILDNTSSTSGAASTTSAPTSSIDSGTIGGTSSK